MKHLHKQYYYIDEDSTTNQRQCNHGRLLEANVVKQYRKGPDRLLGLNDVNSTNNKQPRKLKPIVGSQPKSSSLSRTYALTRLPKKLGHQVAVIP